MRGPEFVREQTEKSSGAIVADFIFVSDLDPYLSLLSLVVQNRERARLQRYLSENSIYERNLSESRRLQMDSHAIDIKHFTAIRDRFNELSSGATRQALPLSG